MKKVMREHMKERLGTVHNFKISPPLPKSLNIELNNTCNHKCFFCPYHGELAIHRVEPAQMEFDFVKKILDQASALDIGCKEVGFYIAGEPLLYRNIVEVIRYAKNCGYEYTFLTTNGSMASRDKLDALVEAGLDSIRFSVNAADSRNYEIIHGRDDFDKVIDNIKYLSERRKKDNIKIAISVSCVVTKKYPSVVEDLKLLLSDYVDDILFIPIIFTALENLDKIKAEYQIIEDDNEIDYDYTCPILFDSMYINAFGKVVPCCDAYHGNVEFFDLHEDFDLVKAWNCEGFKKYRSIFIDNETDEGTICKNCILRRKGVNRFSVDEEF